MRYEVTGTTMPIISINLASGASQESQPASMVWMSPSIRMGTHTGGGILGSIIGES